MNNNDTKILKSLRKDELLAVIERTMLAKLNKHELFDIIVKYCYTETKLKGSRVKL